MRKLILLFAFLMAVSFVGGSMVVIPLFTNQTVLAQRSEGSDEEQAPNGETEDNDPILVPDPEPKPKPKPKPTTTPKPKPKPRSKLQPQLRTRPELEDTWY